jgi:hypothetical protein
MISLSGSMNLRHSLMRRSVKVWMKSAHQSTVPHKLSFRMVTPSNHLPTRGLCYNRQTGMNSLFQTLSKGELADIDKAALVGDMRSMVAVLGSIPAGQSYFLMFS